MWRSVPPPPPLAELHVSKHAPGNPLPAAQDHVPAAYALVRDFLGEQERAQLLDWFESSSAVKRTEFGGEELEPGMEPSHGEPLVLQLYGQSEVFSNAFPLLWSRLLDVRHAVCTAIGLPAEEVQNVDFAQAVMRIRSCPLMRSRIHFSSADSRRSVLWWCRT